jgi:HEAT repeat protein
LLPIRGGIRSACRARLAPATAEADRTMKIHFCALCNESVPQADLDSGRARFVKDRVICPTCEAAMSHDAHGSQGPAPHPQQAARAANAGFDSGERHHPPHVGAEPARVVQASAVQASSVHTSAVHAGGPHANAGPPPAPAPIASTASAPSSNAGLAWVAGLAIGFTALSIFVTDDRLARMGREQAQLQNQLAEKDDALHGLAAEFAKVHPAIAGVETRLAARLDADRQQNAELASAVGAVRDDVARSAARLEALAVELDRIRARVDEPGLGVELEKRLGELSARIAKAEDERRILAEQIAANSIPAPVAVAPGAAPAGGGAAAAPPAWLRSVADLSSPEETVRWDAVTTLGATNDPAVVPHLLPMLTDSTWLVRMAAARVLGEMRVRDAVTPLIAMLEDEDSAARETAWIALRTITGKDLKFDSFASEAERAKRVKAWADWWKKEGGGEAAKQPAGP